MHVLALWIPCCKRPNCNFCISQGSVAKLLRWGGQTTVIYVKLFHNFACKKLSKSANVSWSCSKNKSVTVFLRHSDSYVGLWLDLILTFWFMSYYVRMQWWNLLDSLCYIDGYVYFKYLFINFCQICIHMMVMQFISGITVVTFSEFFNIFTSNQYEYFYYVSACKN